MSTKKRLTYKLRTDVPEFRPPSSQTSAFTGLNPLSAFLGTAPVEHPDQFNRFYRAGDWICNLCGNHNYSFREVCNRCKEQTKLTNINESMALCPSLPLPPANSELTSFSVQPIRKEPVDEEANYPAQANIGPKGYVLVEALEKTANSSNDQSDKLSLAEEDEFSFNQGAIEGAFNQSGDNGNDCEEEEGGESDDFSDSENALLDFLSSD